MMAFLSNGCLPSDKAISPPPVLHKAETINSKTIWSRHDVYVAWNGFSPMLGAASGRICFLGGIENTIQGNLICLNSASGDLLWQVTSGVHATAFYIRADGVYVAYSGYTEIRKYNFEGQVVWSRSILGNGSVYVQSFEDQIHILATPDIYYSLNATTGETIYKIKNRNVIFRDDDQALVYLSGLRSYPAKDKNPMWVVNLDDVLELAPLITRDIIFLRTGRAQGSVYAIERKTGKVLWRKGNTISTIAYTSLKNKIYILRLDGRLIEIDIPSGEETAVAEFRNQDFLSNGDALVGGYEVAFDDLNGVLFLYLGDSRQLFAFRMCE